MKIDQKRRWKMCVVTGARHGAGGWDGIHGSQRLRRRHDQVDDDKFISIGMGTRLSFNMVEDGSASGGQYSNSFGVNNARIYINGGIHKYVKFAFNTECFNCSVGAGNGNGTAGNTFGSNANIGLLDAIGQFEFNEYSELLDRAHVGADRARRTERPVLPCGLRWISDTV